MFRGEVAHLYQLYSLWFDPTRARTKDLSHFWKACQQLYQQCSLRKLWKTAILISFEGVLLSFIFHQYLNYVPTTKLIGRRNYQEVRFGCINRINTFVPVPKPGTGFPMAYIVVFLMLNGLRCSFCWYWGNCWQSLLSFHNSFSTIMTDGWKYIIKFTVNKLLCSLLFLQVQLTML